MHHSICKLAIQERNEVKNTTHNRLRNMYFRIHINWEVKVLNNKDLNIF